MNKSFKMIMALLFNAIVFSLLAYVIGVPVWIGVVASIAISPLLSFVMPKGVMRIGVLAEVWTGELIKKLRSADAATFMDGIPDYSQYAEKDVIHLVDVGGDPSVLINNTTYPLEVEELTDGDKSFSLDKFQTQPTSITDDELYAMSYDKMASVKERHGQAIAESKFKKAIHAIAPSSNSANTPVLRTTGDFENGTYGRRRLTRHDIIELKKAFDKMQVPQDGRRLVLCNDHIADLLECDQKFAQQYYNYTTGVISKMYGFDIYEYVACPYYAANGTKKAIGSAIAAGDYQASVAFYDRNIFKASGTTKMYFSEAKNDPQYQRNLVNFRHMFIALPKKQEAIAAIASAWTATENTLEVDVTVLPQYTKNGGTKALIVDSSAAYISTPSAAWITTEVAADSPRKLKVIVAAQEAGAEARSGSVVITSGTLTKTVTVTQEAGAAI